MHCEHGHSNLYERCPECQRESDESVRRHKQTTPRLLGPSSPFWECPTCKALAQSPLMFQHADNCPAAGQR